MDPPRRLILAASTSHSAPSARPARTAPPAVAAPRFPETRQFLDQIRTRVGKVVVGQDVVVERVLIALLTSGHLLLQGVPGLAKTLLVAAVS